MSTSMQHTIVQQEQQIFGLQEDQQQSVEEISTLRSLVEEAEVEGSLLEELKIFQHEIEYLTTRVWKHKKGEKSEAQ